MRPRVALIIVILAFTIMLFSASPVSASSKVFRVVSAWWEDSRGNLAEAHANSTFYLCIEIAVEDMPLARGYYGETLYSSSLPADAIYGFRATLEPLSDSIKPLKSVEVCSSPLQLGSTVKLRFPVYLGSVEAGKVLRFKLTLSYRALGFHGLLLRATGTQVEYIEVPVTGAPKLVVEASGEVVEGSSSRVEVLVRNIGDAPAREVVLELLGGVKPRRLEVNEIPVGGAAKFNVSAWSAGFTVHVSYRGPLGVRYEEELQVSLKPRRLSRSLVAYVEPAVLRAYANNTARLVLVNAGSAVLNITLGVSSASALVGLSEHALSLEPGERRSVLLWVYPLSCGLVEAVISISGDMAFSERFSFLAEPPRQCCLNFTARAYWSSGSSTSWCESAPSGAAGSLLVIVQGGSGVDRIDGYAELLLPSGWKPRRLYSTLSNGEAVFSGLVAPEEPGTYTATLVLRSIAVTVKPEVPGAQPYIVKLDELRLPVIIHVKGMPRLEASAALQGSELLISLRNEGSGEARNVEVHVSASGAAVSTDKALAGDVPPGAAIALRFNVTLLSATPSFTVRIKYRDPVANALHEDVRAFSFTVKEPVVEVKILNTTVPVGVEAKVAIEVAVLNANVEDAVVSFSSDRAPLLGATTFTLGSMKPGERRTLYLDIYAPKQLAGAAITIYASLRYKYAGITRSEDHYLSLVCTGVPKLDLLSAEAYPENATPGSTISVAALLVNSGTGEAYKVFASLEDPDPFTPIGRERMYLGDVGPGEPVSVSFRLKVPENLKPGNYTVKAKLEFQDDIGRSYSKLVEFTVQVAPRKKAVERASAEIGWQLYALMGVGVAAVAVVALPLILKRRKG